MTDNTYIQTKVRRAETDFFFQDGLLTHEEVPTFFHPRNPTTHPYVKFELNCSALPDTMTKLNPKGPTRQKSMDHNQNGLAIHAI
jgi:hypothetical protein